MKYKWKNILMKHDINLKEKTRYGKIGKHYELDWFEPWYDNLPSKNFQIQRNSVIKNWQTWDKFFLTNRSLESENQKNLRIWNLSI